MCDNIQHNETSEDIDDFTKCLYKLCEILYHKNLFAICISFVKYYIIKNYLLSV